MANSCVGWTGAWSGFGDGRGDETFFGLIVACSGVGGAASGWAGLEPAQAEVTSASENVEMRREGVRAPRPLRIVGLSFNQSGRNYSSVGLGSGGR